MASEASQPRSLRELEAHKTRLLRSVLALSQQEALLVDLDGLEKLLAEKERLIASLQRTDEELAKLEEPAGVQEQERQDVQEEQARLLSGILENERTVEARMDGERRRLRAELRELEQETRLRKYLERPGLKRKKVDLKQ